MKTDAQLIQDAKTSSDAFGELYRRHAGAIHAYYRSRVAPAIAVELTAETFAQAAISLRRFRDEASGSAAPWLFGIAKNLLRRYQEHERVESRARQRLGVDIAGFDEFDSADDRIAAERLEPELAAALAALSLRQREAVRLRVVDELPYSQIAKRLGCSELAARIRVTRALGTLARLLKAS